MFDVTAEEIRIRIEVRNKDQIVEVVHVMRDLSAEDLIAWSRAIAVQVSEKDPAAASEADTRSMLAMWDRLVLRVEGYSVGDAPLGEDWKMRIPAKHRYFAARLLFSDREATAKK